MKNCLFLLTIFILLLFLSSCGADETVSEPIDGLTKDFWTTTYEIADENSSIKMVLNNLDKTGSVEMTMLIPDEEEWWYSLEEGTYLVEDMAEMDFISLLSCGLLWNIYRDFDASEKMLEEFKRDLSEEFNITPTPLTDEEIEEEEKMHIYFKGFKATEFSLKFIDKEDESTILECYNVGLGEEDLKFKAYNTTTDREIELAEEAMWDGFIDFEDDEDTTYTEERTEFASCESLGCDENHIAIGDRRTYEWYYCDCFGASDIAREDRTCFSSIDVAEAVGYYQAWDCE